jgi:hypothetical protein
MLVFIDESGDAGFKLQRGSSPYFVVALVAFRDTEQATRTIRAIDELSARLRFTQEFKFSKSRGEVRDAFFRAVMPYDFCVRAIVVEKSKLYSPRLRTVKESFYSFFVKSMLSHDGGLLCDAKVIIDGSGERAFRQELGTYLRRYTGSGAVRKVVFKDSEQDRLVQLADMCAGAIGRSYRNERSDAQRWHQILGPKIENIWPFR